MTVDVSKKMKLTEKVFKKGNTVCISPSKREEKERRE